MVAIVEPVWPKPLNLIKAYTTTRAGGVSLAPYDGMNLGLNGGDDPEAVHSNRARLVRDLELEHEPRWLKQVHGTNVLHIDDVDANSQADAVINDTSQVACAVLTADCLPVFIASLDEAYFGVAHAGWRGLAAGVLDRTIDALHARGAGRLMAALGPAISFGQFEVGAEVVGVFCDKGFEVNLDNSRPHPRDRNKYFLNLYALAQQRLAELDVVCGPMPNWCTYNQYNSFFSYRRDGARSGRMASLIWQPTL